MALWHTERLHDASTPFFPARPDADVRSDGHAPSHLPVAAAGPTQRVQPGRACASRRISTRSPWATGRAWNQTWSSGVLANSIRVDLIWPREKCVVELDGPDHLDTDKYAADRVRDRALQRVGFIVLRYTNDEVLGDVARILDELKRFLEDRRRSMARET